MQLKSRNSSNTILSCSKYDFLSNTKMGNIKTASTITQKVIIRLKRYVKSYINKEKMDL